MAQIVVGSVHAQEVIVFDHVIVCPISEIDAVRAVVVASGGAPSEFADIVPAPDGVDAGSFAGSSFQHVGERPVVVDRFAQDWA